MSDSYDSVTPKRRPVIGVIFAATLAGMIFGASASAASVQSSVPSQVAQAAAVGFVESNEAVETVEAEVLGISEQGVAPDSDPPEPAEVEPAVLVGEVPDIGTVMAQLEEQVVAVRAAQREAARAVELADLSPAQRAVLLADELGVATTEAEAQAAWDQGYALAGGSNLASFHSTILPCESGNQPNRDSVVGRTDDWGRAQINRPVWRTTFESMTGLTFEENIIRPALNGFMAGYIENVQGLTAWTCWRNR